MKYFYLKIDKLELFQPLNKTQFDEKRLYISDKLYRVKSISEPEYNKGNRVIYVNGSNRDKSFTFLKITHGEKYLQVIKS